MIGAAAARGRPLVLRRSIHRLRQVYGVDCRERGCGQQWRHVGARRGEGRLGCGRDSGDGPVHHGAGHDRDERVDHAGCGGPRYDGRGSTDRDHDVHAGDGRVHADRRQDRRSLGGEAGVLDRGARLRGGVADDGAVAQSGRAACGLVAGGGPRCGARDSRDRCVDGRDLSGQAACDCLRDPRRCEWSVDGRRAADRGLGDGKSLLALRVRRRDGRGADLDAVPEGDPGDGRPQEQARHRWRGAVGRRPWRGRVWRLEVEPVGMGDGEGCGACFPARPVAEPCG